VRIEALLAAGDARQAMTEAKLYHKNVRTRDTERLAARAYRARAEQLRKEGKTAEASDVVRHARERYPAGRDLLADFERTAPKATPALEPPAANGRNAPKAMPVREPPAAHGSGMRARSPEALPPPGSAVQIAVGDDRGNWVETIRKNLTDPANLRRTKDVPSGHPLLAEGLAIEAALNAVTSGPVEDSVVALPQVADSSPLSSWKHLVQALHHLYGGRDRMCRESLAKVRRGEAVHLLVQPIRIMLNGTGMDRATPVMRSLVSKVLGGRGELYDGVRALEEAFRAQDPYAVGRSLQRVSQVCRQHYPGLVSELQRRCVCRSALFGYSVESVLTCMERPCPVDVGTWKICARAAEKAGSSMHAAIYWDRALSFVTPGDDAVPAGPMRAALMIRAARLSAQTRRIDRSRRGSSLRDYLSRAEIAKAFFGETGPADEGVWQWISFVTEPYGLYARACAEEPRAEWFEEWHSFTASDEPKSSPRDEAVAALWSKACPRDLRPLHYLAAAAEKRGKLTKAATAVEKALRIDPKNEKILELRVRIDAQQVLHHHDSRRGREAAEVLERLRDLPIMSEGFRPVLHSMLTGIVLCARERREQWAAVVAAAGAALGSAAAAEFLAESLARGPKLATDGLSWAGARRIRQDEALDACVAVVSAAEDWFVKVELPVKWVDALAKQMSKALPSMETAAARRLAAAVRLRGPVTADVLYMLSAAGLRSRQEVPLFLVQRARSFPGEVWRRRTLCWLAAAALALRGEGTVSLDKLKSIGAGHPGEGMAFFNRLEGHARDLEPSVVAQVVERELEEWMPTGRIKDFVDGAYKPSLVACRCPQCAPVRSVPGTVPPAGWEEPDEEDDTEGEEDIEDDEDQESGDDGDYEQDGLGLVGASGRGGARGAEAEDLQEFPLVSLLKQIEPSLANAPGPIQVLMRAAAAHPTTNGMPPRLDELVMKWPSVSLTPYRQASFMCRKTLGALSDALDTARFLLDRKRRR